MNSPKFSLAPVIFSCPYLPLMSSPHTAPQPGLPPNDQLACGRGLTVCRYAGKNRGPIHCGN